MVTGGWPPPCSHVRTSFYYVDSTMYWSLAQSMGVTESVAKNGGPFLIFIDIKVQIVGVTCRCDLLLLIFFRMSSSFSSQSLTLQCLSSVCILVQ